MVIGDKILTDDFEEWLPKEFDCTMVGDASYLLGIRINRDRENGTLDLDQEQYVRSVLKRFNATEIPTYHTPIVVRDNLLPNEAPLEDAVPETVSAYRSLIGSLMYLMLGTRPDIAYAVGKLARFVTNPSPEHVKAARRVLAYLKATDYWGLRYHADGFIEPEGFVDADHAGDKSDRKSTAGYAFLAAKCVFSWSSKKESTVATSTMEAEYIALFLGSQQAAWIRQFYEQIGYPLEEPTTIYCDSESAIAVAHAEHSHKLSKHLDIKLHSIRERIQNREIVVGRVSSKENCADLLTKGLSEDMLDAHTDTLGLYSFDPDVVVEDEGPQGE